MGTIRALFTRSLAIASLLAAGLLPGALAQGLEPCGRACLRGFVDGYLGALAAHDPARLDVAPGAAYTENGRVATLGEGLWRSAGTPHTYRDYALDHGLAVSIAVFRFAGENGPTLLLAELFKVTGGQLREIRAAVRGIPKGAGAGWPTSP